MKKPSLQKTVVLALVALALGFATPAWAQEADKGRKPSKETLAKYDADRDGKLDEQEQAKWEADVAAKSKETRRRNLEKYDADGDGKLNEGEKEKRKADETAAKETRKVGKETKKKQ